MTRRLLAVAVLLAAPFFADHAAYARLHSPVLAPDTVPFAVGERAEYGVSYNVVGRVGTATMEIAGIDTIRGRPAYHATFTMNARWLVFKVDDRWDTWIDVANIYSHRFELSIHEVNFERKRVREFFPAERHWSGHTNGRQETGSLPTDMPLDDTSFLYFVRTIAFETGREYSYDRYWDADGNPVRLKVLRREQVTVKAGTFDVFVVQPLIKTSAMFSEGGDARLYFAATGDRRLVMLEAKLSFGTLRLQLEKYTAGGAARP